MPEDGIRVIFAMWGQECYTYFYGNLCEEDAFEWLRKMYDKGWLNPTTIEQIDTFVVLYSNEEILEKVGAL